MAEGALYVLGCVGERAEIEIRQVNVREMNDDVEGLQRAYVAVQMRQPLLGDITKSCGIGGREPPQIHGEGAVVAGGHNRIQAPSLGALHNRFLHNPRFAVRELPDDAGMLRARDRQKCIYLIDVRYIQMKVVG